MEQTYVITRKDGSAPPTRITARDAGEAWSVYNAQRAYRCPRGLYRVRRQPRPR